MIYHAVGQRKGRVEKFMLRFVVTNQLAEMVISYSKLAIAEDGQ